MKIRILGCGGSFGSPLAWKKFGNIDIKNKKNFRTRSSVLISDNKTSLLIDTSPDLRQQLYNAKCVNIDAVLYTHIHSDHTSGLPDMRAMSLINDKIIPAYMPIEMQEEILTSYKYIFNGEKDYRPFMKIKNLENKFFINNFEIETFKHNHGAIDAQTFRIGNFAYSTDLKRFYNNDLDKLKNLDLWVVGLLRNDTHPSHAGLDEILEYVDYLKPKKTIFTHMTALIDQIDIDKRCPQNVIAGYDGMEIFL
jgi:phosphoribosyl 1,2-cyclic phosphate phosphodiesterase